MKIDFKMTTFAQRITELRSTTLITHWLLVWLVLLISMPVFAYKTETKNHSKASQHKILILGDSLSAGYGLNQNTGWVHLLSEKLKSSHPDWKVINASISGDTTSGGLRRLPSLLKNHHPQIVLIELGGNDGLRGFMPSTTFQNLDKMIHMSKETKSHIILAGIHLPPNYGEKYEQLFYSNYTRLSAQYNIPLIPFILEGVGTHRELMQADGIHANEKGQPVILKNVLQYLMPVLTSIPVR